MGGENGTIGFDPQPYGASTTVALPGEMDWRFVSPHGRVYLGMAVAPAHVTLLPKPGLDAFFCFLRLVLAEKSSKYAFYGHVPPFLLQSRAW